MVNKFNHLLGKPRTLALASFLKDMPCLAITGGTGIEDDSTSMKTEDTASVKTAD